MMSEPRVYVQSGEQCDVSAVIHLGGPAPMSEIPEPVRALFEDRRRKVTRVVVVHRDLINASASQRDGFCWIYDRL